VVPFTVTLIFFIDHPFSYSVGTFRPPRTQDILTESGRSGDRRDSALGDRTIGRRDRIRASPTCQLSLVSVLTTPAMRGGCVNPKLRAIRMQRPTSNKRR